MIQIICCLCKATLGHKPGGEGESHTYCSNCEMLALADARLAIMIRGERNYSVSDLVIVVGQLLDVLKSQQRELAALRVDPDALASRAVEHIDMAIRAAQCEREGRGE